MTVYHLHKLVNKELIKIKLVFKDQNLESHMILGDYDIKAGD